MRLHFYLSIAILLYIGGCATNQVTQKSAEYSLDIKIRNVTKRVLYAACFSYLKKEDTPRWHWQKSDVYELLPDKDIVIHIDTFKSKRAVPDIFGVLGVFTRHEEAENAIYEILPDTNKIDLDRIDRLQEKTIILGIEKYGVVGDIFDYAFMPDSVATQEVPDLDFTVENQTGRPLYLTAFVYEKKNDMPIWNYDKSEIIRIEPNESQTIKVDGTTTLYDRKYTRGYLAVFDESERKEAYDSTYQLLHDHQKINLGLLAALADRKVILNDQKYGILGDVINFVVKDPRKIANSRSENIKYQPRYA